MPKGVRPPCVCAPGRPCRPCELIVSRADYRAFWGVTEADAAATAARLAAPVAPPPARRDLPCVHEGGVVRPCGSCPAGDDSEHRHVRGCDLHGECTRTAVAAGVRACAGCGDYRPDPALLPRAVPLPLRRIVVRTRAEVAGFDPGGPHVVVSIHDRDGRPKGFPDRPSRAGLLHLRFQDFDPGSRTYAPDDTYNDVPVRDQWMTPAHARDLWAFLRAHPAPCLVVHCNAAVSRSPAVAMAVADVLGLPRAAIDWENAGGRRDPGGPVTNRHVYDLTAAAGREPDRAPAPLALTEVGPHGLAKGQSGLAFNAGLLRYKGRLLMCYRTDWAGAHCHVAELNEDYAVRRTVVLPHLAHPAASYGREDPRLFVFRGRLHVWYVGVVSAGGKTHTNQLYARLTDDLAVEEVFHPEYAHRAEWEKNWSPFEWAGELFAVYSISPHVVLHVRGNHAYPFAETPTALPWSGGHLRGGAPPVLVGDRFYHWFHGRDDSDWTYNVGVCAFEAKPPFRVVALSPDPLLWADRANRDGNYCAVAFPCGALLEGGRWKVAMGWNDRRIKVGEWAEEAVAAALGHAAPPPAWVLVCDELPARRAAALATLGPLGARPWRSVHGATWGLATTKTHAADGPPEAIPPGHVGLILGHYALWQHLWETGVEEAAVFEDDAAPPPDLWARVAAARRALPADWQLVYLGTVNSAGHARREVGPGVVEMDTPFGTHAYLVRRPGLRVLLDACAEARVNIDIQIAENTAGRLRAYCLWPPLVPQRADWPTSTGGPPPPPAGNTPG